MNHATMTGKFGAGRARGNAGFSLIELMIAMVLGLLVLGAAFGIFHSNKRSYQASQSLGRIQESSQIAFEMMARDIREAGGSPCDVTTSAANIVTNAATTWYANWNRALYGYDGSGLTGQVSGTDAIELVRTGDDVHTTTAVGTSAFAYTPSQTYTAGDILMICDAKVFGIFKASSPTATSVSVDTSSSANACAYLPQPGTSTCAGTAAQYQFPKFSAISRMLGVRWFVRDPDADATNGYSLYRQINGSDAEEIVEGVKDMQIQYLHGGSYVSAGSLSTDTQWGEVSAVRVRLTLRETAAASQATTSGTPLERTIQHIVALRNRTL
ncbi:MAG: prepilin-type N-terminal cleavage/methylation domain-containing protein [Thermomonas sp.]|uniref:PilW family protein n=1 Tax=Thermomonas sp. TaxID=1971895 RepID=UPI0039E30EC2